MLHKFVASAGNRSLRPLVVVPTTMSTALVPIGSFAMALVRILTVIVPFARMNGEAASASDEALGRAHLRQICWTVSSVRIVGLHPRIMSKDLVRAHVKA